MITPPIVTFPWLERSISAQPPGATRYKKPKAGAGPKTCPGSS
jgi:hypothetical protein